MHRTENPRCTNPVHDASGGHRLRGWFRQRHTCRECCTERIRSLAAEGARGRYEITKIITREFRSYWCPFCLMSFESLSEIGPKDLKTHCSHHATLLAQKRCTAHNRRWTDCNKCEDPRAGSSFCLCGVVKRKCGSVLCSCPDGVLAVDAMVAMAEGAL